MAIDDIKGSERVSEVLGRWHPSDLALLETAEFSVAAQRSGVIRIVALFQRRTGRGWPDFSGVFARVRLELAGIQSFRVRQLSGGINQIEAFAAERALGIRTHSTSGAVHAAFRPSSQFLRFLSPRTRSRRGRSGVRRARPDREGPVGSRFARSAPSLAKTS